MNIRWVADPTRQSATGGASFVAVVHGWARPQGGQIGMIISKIVRYMEVPLIRETHLTLTNLAIKHKSERVSQLIERGATTNEKDDVASNSNCDGTLYHYHRLPPLVQQCSFCACRRFGLHGYVIQKEQWRNEQRVNPGKCEGEWRSRRRHAWTHCARNQWGPPRGDEMEWPTESFYKLSAMYTTRCQL
jgi:hypothetical protein